MSSNGCLIALKKVLGLPVNRLPGTPRSMRIGHGGTLDSHASGVLVIGLGDGCSLLQPLLEGRKRYSVRALLGVRTSSQDLLTCPVSHSPHWRHISLSCFSQHLLHFVGSSLQTTPLYSARRVNGVRLYRYARRHQQPTSAPPSRQVHVSHLQVTSWEPPFVTMTVECSAGFYVRQLVDDLGQALQCGATAYTITREQQGPFQLHDALKQEQWTKEIIYKNIRNRL